MSIHALNSQKNIYAIIAYAKNNITLAKNWTDEFYATSIKKLRKNYQTIPHILNVVEALIMAKIAFCVASNATHPKMQATLSTTGPLLFFEGKIYSGYDIPRGKTAPDLFLHTTREFNTDRTNWVVIEDSAAGLEEAHATGIPSFAHNPSPGTSLFSAIPFTCMKNLPRLLNL